MIYVGPYLEITATYVPHNWDRCLRPSLCKNQTEGKFCSECGILVKNRFTQGKILQPNVEEVISILFGEALVTCHYDFNLPEHEVGMVLPIRLIPNHHRNPPRQFIFERDNGDFCLDLTDPSFVKRDLTWFSEAFGSEIEMLRTTYFPDVKLLWGVIFER